MQFTESRPTVLVVIGRTGDGKSAFCNLSVQILSGASEKSTKFLESKGAASATKTTLTELVRQTNTLVMDTPGLVDTSGPEEDEANMRSIVSAIKQIGHVNGFLLVLNIECVRFDERMQRAFKLLFDSFGTALLNNMGIVFTRSKSSDAALQTPIVVQQEIIPIMEHVIGLRLSHIPSWPVECHPEDMLAMGSPESYIQTLHRRNEEKIREIQNWAAAKVPADINGIKAAQDAKLEEERRVAAELTKIEAQRAREQEQAVARVAYLQNEYTKSIAQYCGQLVTIGGDRYNLQI